MAEYEESLEELQEKILQYKVQLEAVENALKETGQQESLVQLQADLYEVISLTEDLINYKSSTDEANLNLLTEPSLLIDTLDQTNLNNELSLSSGHLITQDQSLIPPSTQSDQRETQLSQLLGRTCQAQYQGKSYFAEILRIQDDQKLGLCALVEFIGYGNQQLSPLSLIQILVPPSISLCRPGARVQAIFSEDGKWYNCQIDEQTPRGFQVTYTEYGNTEEVPFDRIRFSTSQAKELTRSRIKEIVTPGGYRIPEYLTAKPSDSDTQKLNKKKRIQSIKKKQKSEQINEEAQTRAESWRKFNFKAINKKVTGFISGRGHQSIFKSSDQQNFPNPNLPSTTSKNQLNTFVPRRKHDAKDTTTDL